MGVCSVENIIAGFSGEVGGGAGVGLVKDMGASVGGDMGIVTGASGDAEMGGMGAGRGKGGAAFGRRTPRRC